ncbi:MAG: hypothetical protein E7191_03325 [Erysipelotrichaceae bacterium]|nr:hypothetical protein [Erysipelotrichaceae bacterium]MBR3694564.1 hypothetical protein [Erysipelotrichales bacterium]
MKSAYLSFMAAIGGIILFVSIAIIFQYTTVYKNLSFELRNALIQAGEEAMVPEEVCEMIACSVEEMEDAESFGCNEEGFKEECVDVYMDEDEFFEVLVGHLERLKRTNQNVSITLHAYHNPPFIAKASVRVDLVGSFIKVPIMIEEICLES